MKKTLLENISLDLFPERVREITCGSHIYDSSCSPDARVYFVDRDYGFYIKMSATGTLATEAQMTSYYDSIGLGVRVVDYFEDHGDWLITEAARGEDCTDKKYLDDPVRLAKLLGESLRALHETDVSRCPVKERNESYERTVRENYQRGMFDSDLFCLDYNFENADQAYREYMAARASLTDRVLLHGDFCLPNIILDNWCLSSYIDVGNGGIGDRHIDLFWGVWTLWFNLKTHRYKDTFLDAYGRDKVNEQLLRAIAAAETFG